MSLSFVPKGSLSLSRFAIFLLALATVSVWLSPRSAWSMGKGQPRAQESLEAADPAPTPDLEPRGPSSGFLEQIFREASAELQAVEAMNAAKNFGPAILAAKKIVDRVSIIHPKANTSEHLQVKGVLFQEDLKRTFDQLRNHQKEAIAQAVADSKAGFYLDLLNLWKRAKLAYLKAFYRQMKDRLLEADLRKIREDIFDVYSIAILIEDSKLNDTFLLFDSDVANEDQQYFFDRELIEFALSVQELNTTEKALMQQLEESRHDRLQKHWDGISPPKPVVWNLNVCSEQFKGTIYSLSDSIVLCQAYSRERVLQVLSCEREYRNGVRLKKDSVRVLCANVQE